MICLCFLGRQSLSECSYGSVHTIENEPFQSLTREGIYVCFVVVQIKRES